MSDVRPQLNEVLVVFRHLFLALHLLSAVGWVGGMFFAHFFLRPAAIEVLQPPQRLPLWVATLRRFFRAVLVAVAVLVGTGFALLAQVGFHAAPIGWHVMAGLGLVMAAVFTYIFLFLFPKLVGHCEHSAWPEAGQVQNRIRQLVSLNLALGAIVIVVASFSG